MLTGPLQLHQQVKQINEKMKVPLSNILNLSCILFYLLSRSPLPLLFTATVVLSGQLFQTSRELCCTINGCLVDLQPVTTLHSQWLLCHLIISNTRDFFQQSIHVPSHCSSSTCFLPHSSFLPFSKAHRGFCESRLNHPLWSPSHICASRAIRVWSFCREMRRLTLKSLEVMLPVVFICFGLCMSCAGQVVGGWMWWVEGFFFIQPSNLCSPVNHGPHTHPREHTDLMKYSLSYMVVPCPLAHWAL